MRGWGSLATNGRRWGHQEKILGPIHGRRMEEKWRNGREYGRNEVGMHRNEWGIEKIEEP